MQNQFLGALPLYTDIIATNKGCPYLAACQASSSTLVDHRKGAP